MLAGLDPNQLVKDHQALVKKIVLSYQPKSSNEFDDYYSAGLHGLWKSILKWDPEKGKLTTIAWNSIHWSIRSHIKRQKRFTQQHYLVDCEKACDDHSPIEEYYPILSAAEKEVLRRRLNNHTFKQITEDMDTTNYRTYKRFQTACQKIKEANEKKNSAS